MIEARSLSKRYGDTVASTTCRSRWSPARSPGSSARTGRGRQRHLLVIGRGRLIADCTVAEFIADNSTSSMRVRTPQRGLLIGLAAAVGGAVRDDGDGSLIVHGIEPDELGNLAFENDIRLHELTPVTASLEQAFMDLTAASVDFRAGLPADYERKAA